MPRKAVTTIGTGAMHPVLDEIADLLGPKSNRMLEAHYRHRVRSSFDRHVQHVEAIFSAIFSAG